MKKLIGVLLVSLLFAYAAIAGFEGKQAGTSLKIFNKINCSTGLTCTREGNGEFTMVSSPTITSGGFSIVGIEGGDGTLVMSADEADDNGDTWTLDSVASGNAFTLSNDSSGSKVVKFTVAASDGAVSLVGDLSGDGGDQIVGFLNNQVAATATTITAAQCGTSFINAGIIQIELPEASTVLGCRLTFITGNAANFDVNPDDADQILVQTNAAGDAMRNATLGNSITIEAISATEWAPVGIIGTWSDID